MQAIANVTKKIPGLSDYLAIPPADRESWLENQNWFKNLPDDRSVTCQFCGDTQLIVDDVSNQARRCPCTVGINPLQVVPETFFSLDSLLRGHWEGWPVPRFSEAESIEGFQETASFEAGRFVVEEMLSGNNRALVLCGANGRGKTFTGLMILAEAAWYKKKCYAVKMSRIVELTKGGIDSRDELYATMNRLYSSQAALIDEIGSARRDNDIDHSQRILSEIVDTFHSEKKILILTSNNTKKELINVFHPSIISRIGREAGWCRVVEESTDTKDLRGSLR